MISRSKHIVLGVLYLFASQLFAVQSGASITRACLDKFSNELTVIYIPATDGCSSFKYYRLYGREDATSPYVLLKQNNVLGSTSMQATLPNNKKWQVYISTHSACNGIDSFNSLAIYVDDIAPIAFEPDSVSVELSSQLLIAGWSKTSDKDIMGYSLFKENGGTNLLIKDTFSYFYRFNKSIFDTKGSASILFSIAAFDSCINGGILSSYHSPPKLSISIDPNYLCNKKCTLNIIPYKGWQTDSIFIYRKDESTGIWKYLGFIINSSNSEKWVDQVPQFDIGYTYLVRCSKNTGNISSSSCLVTTKLLSVSGVTPPEISSVSVNGNTIEITAKTGNIPNGFSAKLEKKDFSGNWTMVNQKTNSTGSVMNINLNYTDNAVNTSSKEEVYRIVRINNCGSAFDSTYLFNSILLRNISRDCKWSNYRGWSCIPCNENYEYELLNYYAPIGSWQITHTFNKGDDTIWTIPNSLLGIRKFKILARNLGSGNIAYSNEIQIDLGYDSSAVDTMLIPTGFTPEGLNPIFKISNPAIGLGESMLFIYDRWGHKVWEGDAKLGWNGKIENGEFISQGLYIYRIEAIYRNKRVIKSGTVLLIR